MTLHILLLLVGLVFLMLGGEMVVRGATGLARALGVSPLVIGLTVVAFGTSAPEMAVNVIAVLQLVRPIMITGVVIAREIPMMLLATAAAVVMSFDVFLRGAKKDAYGPGDGLLLLMFFLVFLYYTVGDFVRQRADNGSNDALTAVDAAAGGGVAKQALFTFFGLVALIGGARVTIEAAVQVARTFAVPEEVIGLTLLAVGTSLPELVASVVATMRGHVELAIGNVVGSNIFNLLLVLGVTSLVGRVPVPAGGHYDLAVVVLLSLILFMVSMTGNRRIIRTEAAALLLVYFVYLTWRSSQALSG
jgi:cation:H+ antiporter